LTLRYARMAVPERLADDLWVVATPLPLWVGDIGARMTVIRLGGDLLVHSPVKLESDTREAIDALGRVRWVVGPSRVHHLFLPEWMHAYPEAELCGAPGLAEKRRDLRFAHVLGDTPLESWRGPVDTHLFAGAPGISEVVFLHVPSRTLVLTDLCFDVRPGDADRARVFHWLVGARGFGPHRIIRLAIRDKRAASHSVRRILQWDFDRVVVSHGAVLEHGGRAAFEAAFAWLRGR
jgi:hypothetical protein